MFENAGQTIFFILEIIWGRLHLMPWAKSLHYSFNPNRITTRHHSIKTGTAVEKGTINHLRKVRKQHCCWFSHSIFILCQMSKVQLINLIIKWMNFFIIWNVFLLKDAHMVWMHQAHFVKMQWNENKQQSWNWKNSTAWQKLIDLFRENWVTLYRLHDVWSVLLYWKQTGHVKH